MSALTVRDLHKSYGPARVLNGVSLEVTEGTTTAILGPSGCGKTTLLRLVAGFDRADSGTITLAGRPVSTGRRGLVPDKRNIGYVAQEGALFPHLTVHANIAFGLSRRVMTRSAIRHRVAELLDLVSLDASLAGRYPHELSGGQQQRVALARALARRPALVLLDEPFSSLDTALRSATRTAVAGALRAEQVTTLLVTHDQAEALSMSDQVAVMTHGAFAQTGPAREVYAHPADLDTARLLGPGTALAGKVDDGTARCALGARRLAQGCPDGDATIFVRPEQVRVSPAGGATGGVEAVVRSSGFFGADTILTLQLPDGTRFDARAGGAGDYAVGDRVSVDLLGPVHAYPTAHRGDDAPTAGSPDPSAVTAVVPPQEPG